jgi:hypothetical protein
MTCTAPVQQIAVCCSSCSNLRVSPLALVRCAVCQCTLKKESEESISPLTCWPCKQHFHTFVFSGTRVQGIVATASVQLQLNIARFIQQFVFVCRAARRKNPNAETRAHYR